MDMMGFIQAMRAGRARWRIATFDPQPHHVSMVSSILTIPFILSIL